jgi:hypothetical protein
VLGLPEPVEERLPDRQGEHNPCDLVYRVVLLEKERSPFIFLEIAFVVEWGHSSILSVIVSVGEGGVQGVIAKGGKYRWMESGVRTLGGE